MTNGSLTDRFLNVFVVDVNKRAIPGAVVTISIDGVRAVSGTTRGADGAPLTLQAPASLKTVTLQAEYTHEGRLLKSEPRTVDLDERNFTIAFPEVEMPGEVPKWFPIAGFASGGVTLVYFMVVAFLNQQPNFAHVMVIAFGLALSFSFIGGKAAADGKIPFFKDSPIAFSVGGGVAVFVVAAGLGWFMFLKDQDRPVPNPDFVSIGLDNHTPLAEVIDLLERAKNVTVVFSSTCPAELPKLLVSSGTHDGNTPKLFLEKIRERLRSQAPAYTVNAQGKRHEIVCQ